VIVIETSLKLWAAESNWVHYRGGDGKAAIGGRKLYQQGVPGPRKKGHHARGGGPVGGANCDWEGRIVGQGQPGQVKEG